MPDEKLGRYRLLSLLATGGMGEVFLARQEGPAGFSKTVVIKRILRHLAKDLGFIELFLNEAQLAAQLQHPYIVQVFGLEREADTWFIAMEYVPGKSLRALIDACREKKTTVPWPVAVRLVSQVLQGLEFAHELTDEKHRKLGVLHRDVSPENVLVASSGLAKLVDFGIARAMRGSETRVGRPKGKLAYMAPEAMVPGGAIDRRADVYGAGVVLHELLTLAPPPLGPLQADGTPAPVPYVPPEALPAELRQVLSRALAANPEERWASARDMSEALERWLMSAGHSVSPSTIADVLTEVYGASQRSPVFVGDEVGNTGQLPVFAGTAPLPAATKVQGTAPLLRPEVKPPAVMVPRLAPVAIAPAPTPTQAGPWLALVGLGTGAVFLTITIIAIAGSSPRKKDPAVEPSPAVVAEVDPGPVESVDERAPENPKPQVKRPPRKRTGRVTVRAEAATEVYFANRKLGVTPLHPVEVPAGAATFTLKRLGVTKRVTVRVPAGGNVVLRADLHK